MQGLFLCCFFSGGEREVEQNNKKSGGERKSSAETEIERESESEMQKAEQQQAAKMEGIANSGNLAGAGGVDAGDDEISRSALSTFRAKEEEIERRRMEVRERFQAQLGRVEEESKRLAMIREELETFGDPMRKEVSQIRKRIDVLDKEIKPLGATAQKKEREYKEALDAFNEKNKVKVQLVNRLVELVTESEKMRMKKLEELSNSIDTMRPKDLKSTLSFDN